MLKPSVPVVALVLLLASRHASAQADPIAPPPPPSGAMPVPDAAAPAPAPAPSPPPGDSIPPPTLTEVPTPAPVLPPPVASPEVAVVAPLPAPPPPHGHRVGLVVGIISLPRPVEAELSAKLGAAWAFGAELNMLPTITFPGGSAKIGMLALQGNARWFPFRGAFFLGAGLGYQTFKASLDKTVDNGSLEVTADMSGVFVAPQIGWLWVMRSGLALGLGLTLQIPIPKDPVVTSTYGGQPVPQQANAQFSQDVVDSARRQEDTIRTGARYIVKYPLPTLDLLRVGFFF